MKISASITALLSLSYAVTTYIDRNAQERLVERIGLLAGMLISIGVSGILLLNDFYQRKRVQLEPGVAERRQDRVLFVTGSQLGDLGLMVSALVSGLVTAIGIAVFITWVFSLTWSAH